MDWLIIGQLPLDVTASINSLINAVTLAVLVALLHYVRKNGG